MQEVRFQSLDLALVGPSLVGSWKVNLPRRLESKWLGKKRKRKKNSMITQFDARLILSCEIMFCWYTAGPLCRMTGGCTHSPTTLQVRLLKRRSCMHVVSNASEGARMCLLVVASNCNQTTFRGGLYRFDTKLESISWILSTRAIKFNAENSIFKSAIHRNDRCTIRSEEELC